MKKILNLRFLILSLWLIAAVLLTAFQPDINAILRQRGESTLGEKAPSRVAASIEKRMSTAKGSGDILVFYDKKRISDKAMAEIGKGIDNLKDDAKELGLGEFIDPFASPGAKKSLFSKDSTTLMISFKLDKKGREVNDIKKMLDKRLKNVNTKYYLSGEDFISNDYLKVVKAGVDKSTVLTVIFILAILIFMFRSVVTPLISLCGVAITYLCSMGIAAQLIDKCNFTVTSLTQMLLVLILFGIGTDYNILLFNRYKEELSHGYSVDEAIINTYKTAGKTVLFSTLTVFVAFMSLSFSKYGIYRSGNVVGIGCGILILQIMTLTPSIMKLTGKKLFWPSKGTDGHKDSKVWAKITSTAVKHPMVSVVIVLIIIVPTLIFNNQKLSFDSLRELGDDYPSSKGFNIVAKHFSRGQALPTTVLLESKQPMDNNEALAVIDSITEKIKGIKGIKQVSSVTQPEGTPIKDFYTNTQTESVTKGIDATKTGVDKIKSGLNLINNKLNAPDFSSVNGLVSGTGQLKTGYDKITSAINQLSDGIQKGAGGAVSASNGIKELKDGMSTISKNTAMLSNGLVQLKSGSGKLLGGYKQIEEQLPAMLQGFSSIGSMLDTLGKAHSELYDDKTYSSLKLTAFKLQMGLSQISYGFKTLNANYQKFDASLATASDGLVKISDAQNKIVAGLSELQTGLNSLATGLQQGSKGNKAIAQNMEKLNSGLQKIYDGQQQLNSGLSTLTGGMSQLKDGIGKSSNGLGEVSKGLQKTNNFLNQLKASKTFFIPTEALANEGFKQSEKTYMSKDKKITKMLVILKDDPYSIPATDTVRKINSTLSSSVKGTPLGKVKYGAAGPTSTTADTNDTLKADFGTTSIIVILSILVVLLFVIRAIWPSLCIVASLLSAYYAAIFVTGIVSQHIMNVDGISSFVPFFAFIAIVALGVDYSIFLMTRYKEYTNLPHTKAIIMASKNIGGVVISAAVILGGTFATLMPSGLILLFQLAFAIIIGLILLCFVLLPYLLPALIAIPENIKNAHNKKTSTTGSDEQIV